MGILSLLRAKLWKWACAIGAILAAIAGVWLWGREKGKEAEQTKTRAAQDAAASAQATAQQLESRHETDVEVQKLPDAPAQPVGTADPKTAAGKLSDSWARD